MHEFATAEIEREIADEKFDLDRNFFDVAKKAKSKLDGVQEDSANTLKKATNDYGREIESVKNNNLKKGLGRSSITQKAQEKLSDDFKTQINYALNDANKKVESIENELKILNEDYRRAVENLDVGKSVAIKQKVNELKAMQADKIKEIEKYNASIDENKRLYDVAKSKHDEENAPKKLALKRDLVVDIIEKLRTLNEDEVYEILDDEDVKNALGDEEIKYLRRTYETFK